MKLAMTTFVIPFAFVFSPELMSFPNMTWAVVPAIAEVVFVQWLISVAAFGYFIRVLMGWERLMFAIAALMGFMGLTMQANYGYLSLAVTVAMAVYVFVSRSKSERFLV